MNRKFNIWLVLWSAWNLVLVNAAFAESDLSVTADAIRVWQKTDGLPSDVVTTVVQTRDRFLWIGTDEGLVRFDGVNFTGIKLPVANTNLPPGISALCEDSNGDLWIGTQRDGLFQLVQGQLRHFSRPQGLLDDNVTCLAMDKPGRIWIGGRTGLSLWTGGGFNHFTNGLPDEYISSIHAARSGTVWITTRAGMCRYIDGRIIPFQFETQSQGRNPEYLGAYEDRNGSLWAFGDTYLINLAEGKRFNYFHSSESASVRIWSLCEGRDGRLWIGTSGRGLFCFENGRFQPVVLGENRWPYDVRSICEDSEGNLWLGTSGGGLLQLRPQSSVQVLANQSLPGGVPTTLALDARGSVLAGFLRGGLFVGEAGRFERIESGGLAVQNLISSLCVASNGTVWAGTFGNGVYGLQNEREAHLTTANGLRDDDVLSVCMDNQGTLWASTAGGGLQFLSRQKMIGLEAATDSLTASITAMIPSSNGLWLGTADGSILREENGRLSALRSSQSPLAHAVLALHEDRQSRLWIGTDGDGLECITPGATSHWSTQNGLPSPIVEGVVEDAAKNLWLATGAGIYRVSRNDVAKALANPEAPLVCKMMSGAKTVPEPGMSFCGTRAAVSRDGTLWFATADGVLKVDAHQSEIPAVEVPLYLESATFNNHAPISLLQDELFPTAITNGQQFRAPIDLRSLDIQFTAVGFTAPAEIRFRHKLEGFDSDWVDDGTGRLARYGKLPFGTYRFRVAARNPDGEWQEARTNFAFVVPTPLYFQTWAICLYGLTVSAMIAGIVRMVSHRRLRSALARMEQQHSVERERMRIARDLHDEIGSKLTKISFLSEHAQVNAESNGPLAGKINSIARTTRELLRTMDEIVWAVNPRNDTLENLITYFSHYAAEYFQNTSIQCEMQLPRETPHYMLSSEVRHNVFLTFEEALNNVLRHSAATLVKIELSLKGREFEIKITDNGKGFERTATTTAGVQRRGGNGLKNMRQRLMDVGGECLIFSRAGAGTSIGIRIQLDSKTTSKP